MHLSFWGKVYIAYGLLLLGLVVRVLVWWWRYTDERG